MINGIASDDLIEMQQDQQYQHQFDEVEQLLRKWGLSEVKDKFKDHEITLRALKYLTKEDISELIPKIGPRAIFRARLFEWQQSTTVDFLHRPPLLPSSRNSTNYSYSMPSSIVKVESGYEDNDDVIEISSSKHNQETPSTSITSQDLRPSTEDTNESNIHPKAFAHINNFSSNIGALTNNRKKVLCPLLKLDIRSILMNNYEGQQAIQYYKANGKLDYSNRKKVVSAIISLAINRNIEMGSSEFKRMAKEIIQLFPNESYFTYYIPREGSQNPRGALYNKFLNLSRKLRQDGLLDYRRMKSPLQITSPLSLKLRSTKYIKYDDN